MITAFQFSLEQQVLEGLVVIGRYDGQHACLSAGTPNGKVLLHCPYTQGEDGRELIRYLNISRRITAMRVAPLVPNNGGRDVLLIGTPSSLLVYDVEENADVFFRDMQDGVGAVAVGTFSNTDSLVAVVGGNCSIIAFDPEGNEVFWTVCGDNVSALAFCDTNDDGIAELIVGTEDFDIKILQYEDVIGEISETDVVRRLEPLSKGLYAYALANGTVGVYSEKKRLWRMKSKTYVGALCAFDIDQDGQKELAIGWSNGKIEIRDPTNGEVKFKDHFQDSIAAVVAADYRNDGKETLMAVSANGDVKGWLPTDREIPALENQTPQDNTAYRDLLAKRQELQSALLSFQEQSKLAKSSSKTSQQQQGIIPTNTDLKISLRTNKPQGTVEMHLMTSNLSVIKTVHIFAEFLFDDESCMLHPMPPSNNVVVQISPNKDMETPMHIIALVGTSTNSLQYHVFEHRYTMPKFSMYHYEVGAVKRPEGHVYFPIKDRSNRVWMWIDNSFIGVDQNNARRTKSDSTTLFAPFTSLRNGKPLIFEMKEGRLTLWTDDIEVAGGIVQDLCVFLQMPDVESCAHFPEEIERFSEMITVIEGCNSVRHTMTAGMADDSNFVKALIVKSEDYRILGDYDNMRKVLIGLLNANSELLAEYKKRSTNHQLLLEKLKEMNMVIQRVAGLRLGQARTRVISHCRQAIKKANTHELAEIMRTGSSESA
eukprot:GEMP01024761.1.p1 GENE.GEMP01024761.1~~GEMP01024761.1.p1  ORF type:complete len:710 (+),score=124.12 GEMP01024761.1:179-2308(+)